VPAPWRDAPTAQAPPAPWVAQIDGVLTSALTTRPARLAQPRGCMRAPHALDPAPRPPQAVWAGDQGQGHFGGMHGLGQAGQGPPVLPRKEEPTHWRRLLGKPSMPFDDVRGYPKSMNGANMGQSRQFPYGHGGLPHGCPDSQTVVDGPD
jgi:hypothetical protein